MDRATAAAMSQYRTNEKGERVIPASRRPDGSWRKERVVRDGYIPPEEQGVYMSRGRQFRAEAEKERCPGFDDADSTPMSKAAKKNAARKAKKVADAPAGAAKAPAVAAATASMASMRVAEPPSAVPAAAAPAMPPEMKRLRALQKKMRQADALLVRQQAGDALTPEEQLKIDNMADWDKEIKCLEELIAQR